MRLVYIQTVLVLATILGAAVAQDEPMRLVYFVEHEDEQAEDFIEISLQIESQSHSLVDAISAAGKVAHEVSTLAVSYCKEYTKKGKGDCKEAVEVSKFQIQPQYQMVRKEATFSTFMVTHQVTVKVFNPENIGYLVDSFLKYPDLTLKEFNWQPLEEVDAEQAAVKEGVEQGEQLCEQVGLTLTRLVDLKEIIEQAGAEEEEEEDEQAEEEPEVTIYRFEVECGKLKKK